MWPFRKKEVEKDECCDGAGSCIIGHTHEATWLAPPSAFDRMFGPREPISEEEQRLRKIEAKL